MMTSMAGHLGYSKILGRIFRVSKILGFENCNPKFVENNQNLKFRVPDISSSGSDLPEQPKLPTKLCNTVVPDFNRLGYLMQTSPFLKYFIFEKIVIIGFETSGFAKIEFLTLASLK